MLAKQIEDPLQHRSKARTCESSNEALHASEDIVRHWKSNSILGCRLNYITPTPTEGLRNSRCHLHAIGDLNQTGSAELLD